jgi:hypothetical protein
MSLDESKQHKTFKKQHQKSKIIGINHEKDCKYGKQTAIPIVECACRCYEKYWFKAGFKAVSKEIK